MESIIFHTAHLIRDKIFIIGGQFFDPNNINNNNNNNNNNNDQQNRTLTTLSSSSPLLIHLRSFSLFKYFIFMILFIILIFCNCFLN